MAILKAQTSTRLGLLVVILAASLGGCGNAGKLTLPAPQLAAVVEAL